MNQMTAKYPDPNMRRQVCQRLMAESSAGSKTASAGAKKPNPFQKG